MGYGGFVQVRMNSRVTAKERATLRRPPPCCRRRLSATHRRLMAARRSRLRAELGPSVVRGGRP